MRLQLGNGKFEDRQLINAKEGLEPTHTPHIWFGQSLVTHRDIFYALGWLIDYSPRGPIWYHNGAFNKGARTLVRLIPARHLGIVVLTSAFPTGFPEVIVDSFFDIVFDGAPSCDWTVPWNRFFAAMLDPAKDLMAQYGKLPSDPSPALPLATYAGKYENDYLGQVRVVADGADLMLALGAGGKVTHRLTHFDRDTFTMRAFPEWPDAPCPLVFGVGEHGKATTLTIDWHLNNPFTLQRVT
jgi:CubicO group peptidase (beta-lactamase class C family)